MKKLTLFAVAALAPGLALAEPQEVQVQATVPSVCTAASTSAITANPQLNPTTLVPTTWGFTSTATVDVVCNVAGSVLTLSATPFATTQTTNNTDQFTNTVNLGIRLGGANNDISTPLETNAAKKGAREADVNTATWHVGSIGNPDGRPASFLYGRYITTLPLYVNAASTGGKGLVAGDYTGTVTVTLTFAS